MSIEIPVSTYKDVTKEQTLQNPLARLVPGQRIVEIPEYALECGEVLTNFPVAYKTWGKLNKDRDNVLLICHALTGSCDVQDWWGPLLGTEKTFDPSRFFIICINFLGSPYGSVSPLTIDKATGKPYGPLFPLVTVKDDVGVQKLVLDSLGINSIACVIGGSMGGMITLEFSSTFNGSGYIKSIIALATAARASAWCISWNETQRQSIFSDPYYDDGYYYESGNSPNSGLSAARMAALLTYRSRNSFETRFGRKLPSSSSSLSSSVTESRIYPKTNEEENWLAHNEGSTRARSGTANGTITNGTAATNGTTNGTTSNGNNAGSSTTINKPQTYFTAQSYLRYQGNKFIKRFDANCYISISRKLDTHDITRGKVDFDQVGNQDPLPSYLETLSLPHLIIGITSDGLFTFGEQQLLGDCIPDSELHKLNSPEGHDAFLLEFETIDKLCLDFLNRKLGEYYDPTSEKYIDFPDWPKYVDTVVDNGGESVFGEVEKNITNW